MFTQFFGNYLLNQKLVTTEQLMEGLQENKNTRLKLGVLAINAGYMTASQVDEVHTQQTHIDKRFGDIAVDMGFLTSEQVDELLNTQKVGYLLLGQALVDKGYLTNSQFETSIRDYKEYYQIMETDISNQTDQKAIEMVQSFFSSSQNNSKFYFEYIALLLKSFIRFIGDDFILLQPKQSVAASSTLNIMQPILGEFSSKTTILFPDENVLLSFANAYANESFSLDDREYLEASAADFLNLHNGLFTVNISNDYNVELRLEPPVFSKDMEAYANAIVLPVQYTFGVIEVVIPL